LGSEGNSTQKNPSFTFSNFGNYKIKLLVSSSSGCSSDTFRLPVTVKDKPAISIATARDSICVGTSLILTSNATVQAATINQYNWQLGAAVVSNNSNTFTQNLAVGNYSFTHWVNSNNGCSSDTITKNITVVSKPVANFSFTNNCGSRSIPFTATYAGTTDSVTQHYWSFGNNSFSTLPNPTNTYSSFFDSYLVKYVAISSIGCVSDTVYQTVLVKDKPTATLAYGNNACAGLPFGITASSTVNNASIINQQWWVNAVPVINNNNTLSLTKPAGNYTIQYIAASSRGCVSDTVTKNIVVEALPVASFTVANTCNNNPIAISNNSTGNIATYLWQLGNGDSTTAIVPVYQYAATGNYTIRLTASTANNCSAVATNPISIEAKPVAAFSVSESCVGKAIVIQNNSSGNSSNYSWQSSDGGNFIGATPTIVFSRQGNYNLQLTAQAAFGCSSTASKSLSIRAVVLSAGKDTAIVINQPLQLTASGAASYLWQPAALLSAATAANPIFKVANSGVYPLLLKGTTSQGCEGTDSITITVYKNKAGLLLPNAFSPNSDGWNDMLPINCAGLQTLNAFRIYNRYGQTIYEQRHCSNSLGWDGTYKGAPQNAGTYVYVWEGIDFSGKPVNGKGTVVLLR